MNRETGLATDRSLINGTSIDQPQAKPSLMSPAAMKRQIPVSADQQERIERHRREVNRVLDGEDDRMLVIVGPCSIHDPDGALEYGQRLSALNRRLGDKLLLVMRAYFEKPRTTVGWKGFLHDPDRDGSHRMQQGIELSRDLLLKLHDLDLPLATEALSPLAVNYLQDLISWTAIGARTTESQIHREMASGLASAVGFKNATDGGVKVATHAIVSAASSHEFLGVSDQGTLDVRRTQGNPYGHLVLRGGNGKPNYDALNVARCEQMLNDAGLPARLVVDCSHENSGKDPHKQPVVLADIAKQRGNGTSSLKGVMLESYLKSGNQCAYGRQLDYGVSVTDACLGWEATEQALERMADTLDQP